MKRNLTVQLDEEVVLKARVLAARRATSVSRLVADEIRRLVTDDDRYRQAQRRALRQLERGFRLGGRGVPDRDALHDR